MFLFSVLWLVSCTEDLQLRRGRVENDSKMGQGYYHTLLHCKFSTAPQTFSLVFSHEGNVADDGFTNQPDGRFCEHYPYEILVSDLSFTYTTDLYERVVVLGWGVWGCLLSVS